MVDGNTFVSCNMMWHDWLNFTTKKNLEKCEQENVDVIENYQILAHDLYTSRGRTRILKTRRLRWAGRAARDLISRHDMCASDV